MSQQIVEIGLWLLDTGLVTGTAGNISVRCLERDAFLITPTARDYRLMTRGDLVRVHLESGRVEGRRSPSSEWLLHAEIYKAREDVNAVIHHHSTYCSAVAAARKTIPVILDEAADLCPILAAPYAPSGSRELAKAAAELLGRGGFAILLANHVAVAVGRNLEEAAHRAGEMERLAKIYLYAELLGGAHSLDETTVARNCEFIRKYRAVASEDKELRFFPTPRIAGHVGVLDLVNFGFRTAVTFASMMHRLVLQKLHRWHPASPS